MKMIFCCWQNDEFSCSRRSEVLQSFRLTFFSPKVQGPDCLEQQLISIIVRHSKANSISTNAASSWDEREKSGSAASKVYHWRRAIIGIIYWQQMTWWNLKQVDFCTVSFCCDYKSVCVELSSKGSFQTERKSTHAFMGKSPEIFNFSVITKKQNFSSALASRGIRLKMIHFRYLVEIYFLGVKIEKLNEGMKKIKRIIKSRISKKNLWSRKNKRDCNCTDRRQQDRLQEHAEMVTPWGGCVGQRRTSWLGVMEARCNRKQAPGERIWRQDDKMDAIERAQKRQQDLLLWKEHTLFLRANPSQRHKQAISF